MRDLRRCLFVALAVLTAVALPAPLASSGWAHRDPGAASTTETLEQRARHGCGSIRLPLIRLAGGRRGGYR